MRRPRCRCGVYIDCHQRIQHKPRKASRIRLWFQDHSVWQHLAAPIWLRIPEKRRWDVVSWLNRSPRRCWCDLVSDAMAYREKDACDTHVPLPIVGRDPQMRCASVCDWSHLDHTGEHPCTCYCGKFQFTARDGAIDRRVTQ